MNHNLFIYIASQLQNSSARNIALALILMASCSRGDQTGQRPVPVTVGKVSHEDISVHVQAIGKLDPETNVNIRAKVSGTLKEAPIPEGSIVQKDDLLFRFGKSSYEAKLERAEANLLHSQANLLFAKNKLQRFLTLVEKEYVTELSIEEMQKEVAAYEALVKANQVEVQLAKMDLEDTAVLAPISGILGEKKVGVHNSVEKGTILATIMQINELYVDFYLPEKFLQQVIEAINQQKDLEVQVETQDKIKSSGYLTFMETGIDPLTGTVLMRGLIKNDQKVLQPGQYVHVQLKVKELKNANVLPLEAVQIGQQGHYIYIVKADHTVELKIVTPIYTSGLITVVAEEIPEGTEVVTDGHINLVPGAKVMIKEPK